MYPQGNKLPEKDKSERGPKTLCGNNAVVYCLHITTLLIATRVAN